MPECAQAARWSRRTAAITHWSHPAGSSSLAASLVPGMTIGERYKILRVIGQGGMGAVCQARDLEVDRVVALKVIRADLAGQSQVLQRFKRELVLAQRVTHPNVVRIYDLGVAGEMRFITMEYIQGEDLRKIASRRGTLPIQEAATIMAQVFRGLEAAHQAGIVHRDLKPANIMIDSRGRVAVMDFGIARSMELAEESEEPHDPELTSTLTVGDLTIDAHVVGTPVYMSPEQARRGVVDHRSDLFSAGLIFYSLIAGSVPLVGSNLKETMKLHASTTKVEPLIIVKPDVPAAVNEIVMRCLEVNPEARYQSAGEAAQAIEAFQKGTTTTPALKPSRRGRVAALGIAAALFLLAGWLLLRPRLNVAHSDPVSVIVADFPINRGTNCWPERWNRCWR